MRFLVVFIVLVFASFSTSCSEDSDNKTAANVVADAAVVAVAAVPGTGNDDDGDGIKNNKDNCPQHPNVGQDDTDNDGCGNVCDGDFDQDWIAGWLDFGALSAAVGTVSPVHNLTEPVDDQVTLPGDVQVFTKLFGKSVCGR